MITFGIPSFNRAKYLVPLVESIFQTSVPSFEVLIVEDHSPERAAIRDAALGLKNRFEDGARTIRYLENQENIGYDKNLKEILLQASGDVVIFFGNDDLAAGSDLCAFIKEINSHPEADVFLRGYSTFDDLNGQISTTQIIRASRVADQSADLPTVYRFSGIISGFAVRTKFARRFETSQFDGGLYYQLYLALAALTHSKVFISSTLPVKCRRDIPPDFGSSANEPGFVTGLYKLEARIRMINAQLAIGEFFSGHHSAHFMSRYREAMSKNIAPHLGELQGHKWQEMPSMYYYLWKKGIGRNLRSLVILFLYLLFSKTFASRILNATSNAMGLSRAR